MITLFVKTGCPYCAKAIAALDASGVSYEKKNISEESVVEELIALGGKKQVPFLIEGETKMFESDAIVAYVEKNHSGKNSSTAFSHLRIHKSEDMGTCHSHE